MFRAIHCAPTHLCSTFHPWTCLEALAGISGEIDQRSNARRIRIAEVGGSAYFATPEVNAEPDFHYYTQAQPWLPRCSPLGPPATKGEAH